MPLSLAWIGVLSWKKLLLKALPYLIVIAAVLGTGWYIYHLGSNNGEAKVQSKWTAEKLENERALTKLRKQMLDRESTHRKETQRISDDLVEANQKYASSVAALDAEYSHRLSNSEQRAAYYQRMSSSGPVEQTNLAGHAAKLDRSLEEGRRLVQELTATVRQRDAQVTALGQQILTDRALIGEKDGQQPDPAK